jgi:transposase
MDGFWGFETATAEELHAAVAIMDPLHVVQLAGTALGDPLHGARRTLPTGATPAS